MIEYIKKNWKSIAIYGSFLVVIIICAVSLISKCVNDSKPNGTTVINSSEFIDMIEDDEDFLIVFGQYECSACREFDSTLRKYTSDGKKVYYLYLDNDNDINLYDATRLIFSKLKELPKSRNITRVMTPLTVFVEDGIFKDGYVGHVSSDSDKYDEFKNIAEGVYVKRKTVLSASQMMDKINSGDEFVFTIGQHGCAGCAFFETTINRYLQEGNNLYYVYVDDLTDSYMEEFLLQITNKIAAEIPEDREIGLYTPTTIYVKNGIFIDGYQGVIDTYDSDEYEIFVDMMKGEYAMREFPLA